MKQFIILLFVISSLNNAFAQKKRPKQFFVHWGWNRAVYTGSNLQLKGYDYNLKLYNIKANDRVTKPVSYYNYLRPDRITIPQTNFRLGYFVKKNKAIVFAIDHMKYVMNSNQAVKVKGTITKAGPFQRSYDETMVVTDDFLTFEHTDGLNYVNLGVENYKVVKQNEKQTFVLNYIYGANAGLMIPKTNVKLLDYDRTDRYHVSGISVQVKNAIQATFVKHINLRVETMLGYIYMPNIALHKTGIEGKGKQKFAYAQANWQIGYVFKIK